MHRRVLRAMVLTVLLSGLLLLPSLSLAEDPQVICLDPGHGGTDPGAVNGLLLEKEINLDVAFRVRDLLQADGYQVVLTRADNESNPSNEERYTAANAAGALVLVSIHTNSVLLNQDTVDGSMALYFKKSDLALAQVMRETLYGTLHGTAEAADEPIAFRDFGLEKFASRILMSSTMPATIAEPVCMSHPTEAAWLATTLYTDLGETANPLCEDCRREEIAQAIFKAIVQYVGQAPPVDEPGGGPRCDTPPCNK